MNSPYRGVACEIPPIQREEVGNEKGFISFAARESRGTGRVERRESDETAQ
jgi:hypothetical protein